MENLEKQFVQVGDIQLHVVMSGPADGEPVFFLHGFPEFWYGWHNQIPFFAEQGFRVIVPDQRGYNLSDKPDGVSNYVIDTLAQDVVNLADVLGYDKFNLVGHDWGAAVSWWVATIFPDRLKKLTILNVPYPTIMLEQFSRGNVSQLLKSWYIGFFQIPFLPEAVGSLGDYKGIEQMLIRTGKSDTFSEDDLEEYRRAWAQPGALTAMINWYRAMRRSASASRPDPRIVTPTLMLWGEQDIALGKEMARPSIDLCDDGELIYFPKATHWVQHDEAQAVNHEILRFLRQEATEADA